jgi:hypothetical protein
MDGCNLDTTVNEMVQDVRFCHIYPSKLPEDPEDKPSVIPIDEQRKY